jgi:hypothetical protein
MLPFPKPRAWHVGVIALCGALELGVLWMAAHPKADQDYIDYYITRTASCFPRMVNGVYPLGTPISFVPGRNGYTADVLRWCGFTPPSATGIRSFGDYGILRLKFTPPDDDLLLTFTSWVNTFTGKPVRDVVVSVNGEKLTTLSFATPARINGKVIIPEAVAKKGNGTLDIRFDVPRIGPPGTNSEPVTLQLRLEAMRVTPFTQAVDAPVAGTVIDNKAAPYGVDPAEETDPSELLEERQPGDVTPSIGREVMPSKEAGSLPPLPGHAWINT